MSGLLSYWQLYFTSGSPGVSFLFIIGIYDHVTLILLTYYMHTIICQTYRSFILLQSHNKIIRRGVEFQILTKNIIFSTGLKTMFFLTILLKVTILVDTMLIIMWTKFDFDTISCSTYLSHYSSQNQVSHQIGQVVLN